jgi:hypothetical protein
MLVLWGIIEADGTEQTKEEEDDEEEAQSDDGCQIDYEKTEASAAKVRAKRVREGLSPEPRRDRVSGPSLSGRHDSLTGPSF